MQRGLDLHLRALSRRGFKLISAGDARPIEQGEQFEGLVSQLGLLEPEMGKIRKFLRFTSDRVHRHASGGDAVAELCRHRAVITRAHEHHELKRALHQRVGCQHAKARVALRVLRVGRYFQFAILEVLAIKRHVHRLRPLHVVKHHRLLEHPAGVEKLDAVSVAEVRKQRLVPQVADLAMPVVFQPFKERVELLRWSLIGLERELRGYFLQICEAFHRIRRHLGQTRGDEQ